VFAARWHHDRHHDRTTTVPVDPRRSSMMSRRRIVCPTAALLGAACLALSCRAPSAGRSSADPLVLVTPETGPSALQARLADTRPMAASAGEPKLDAAIDAFHARTKARRGYLAVDKPLYRAGETIWFRAFDLASADLSAGDRDTAMIRLITPRGSALFEKKVLVEAGGAAGEFDLPDGIAGGEYVLRAEAARGTIIERKLIVSSYEAPRIKKKLELVRKAYGPGDTVAATVALHRGTGEPLAGKAIVGLVELDGAELARVPVVTDAGGNALVKATLPAEIRRGDGLLTVLVEDGGVTESVQKRIPIVLAQLALALYPEGGDLIEGLPGRVYFAARSSLDKPADVEGRVVDDRGGVVALLRSHHDGMGRFELEPRAGRTYHVEITRPAGIAQRYELPRAKPGGCAMQAVDDFASARPELRIALWCTRAQEVAVSAVLRERRVATAKAAVPRGEPAVIALPMPPGAQGAVRVTAFDRGLAPLAERLVYRNRGKDLRISIRPSRAAYHPRDPVTLAIETRGPDGAPVAADLALSVVDDTVLAFADDKQATLLARMYLEAELPGQKIEEPVFYFSDDPKAPAALDLVLGTHGWRRFEWKPVLEAPPPPPIDDPWAFTGVEPGAAPRAKRKQGRRVAAAAEVEAAALPPQDAPEERVVARQQADAKPAAPRRPAPGKVPAARPAEPVVDANREVAGAPVPEAAAAMAPPPMPAPRVMRRAERRNAGEDDAMADMAADEEEMAGEIVEIRAARGARGGFGVGGEVAPRGRRIRGARARDANLDEAWKPDPFADVVPERVFPAPSYTARHDGPRTDFRDTLLWAPRLRTDAAGTAQVRFYLSDAVSSFKVTAEGTGGGQLGRGEAQLSSKKPVALVVKLPLEVSAGDRIRLPVTVANETMLPYDARLSATFGKAFAIAGGAAQGQGGKLALGPGERRTLFYDLTVVGDGARPDDGKIALAVDASGLRDEVERTVAVAPIGFPQEVSLAGTLRGTARHEVHVSDVLPGTMRGSVTLYPSPLATMMKGTEAMIAEPSGCFEQASSTTYPNIMILGYLEEHGAAAPEIVAKTHKVLDKGYKLLTGYETAERGYEWFGGSPGHEALTAYGLLEFRDMAKVFGGVDSAMVDRTRAWLRGRRDGKGGYLTNAKALDSFGRASPEVTDGYISYALAQAGERDLGPEIGRQRGVAASTKDPYLMALATQVLLDTKQPDAAAAVRRLAAMQAADGSFAGADHSITRSGGDSLVVETTALAALALMAGGPEHTAAVRKAIEWMNGARSGGGRFGSTQATVLSLKAMAAYARASRRTEAAGAVSLAVNGKVVQRVRYEKGHQGAIELPIAEHLRPGKNVIELTVDSEAALPYSGGVEWGSKVPAAHPATKVRLAAALARREVALGEGVRMNVRVENATAGGVPMTLARVGLPGGLTFQTWQLQELRDRKLIDFYETRAREVILYFRALPPGAVREIPLELMATVPGTFTAPASRAYLYYTDEHKHWIAPATVTVTP
jgi:alpha-2-macroglobulin-like protein